MRLTKLTGHALRILIDCSRSEGQLVKTAEISERLDITPKNVFKIVHILTHAGFIVTVRGPNGGIRLARPADQVRIGDVVRATETTDVEVGGAEAGAATNAVPSSINRVLDDALGAFISILDLHTLQDMTHAKPGSQGEARHPQTPAKSSRRAKAHKAVASGGEAKSSRGL